MGTRLLPGLFLWLLPVTGCNRPSQPAGALAPAAPAAPPAPLVWDSGFLAETAATQDGPWLTVWWAKWVVQAPAGTNVSVAVTHDRVGSVTREIELPQKTRAGRLA